MYPSWLLLPLGFVLASCHPSIHPARAAQTEEEPMSKNDQAQDDESQSDQVQNSDTQNAEDWQEGDQLRP